MNDRDLKDLLADGTASNKPAAAISKNANAKIDVRRVDEREISLRKEAVANMLVNGVPRDQIVRAMGKTEILAEDGKSTQPGFAMSAHEVDLAIKAVRAEWEEEESDFKRDAKAMTQRRLLREINEARRDKAHNAVANLEKVLMMVQGTAEQPGIQTPTDNRITDALLRLLGESDPVKVRILIEKERTLAIGSGSEKSPLLPSASVSSVSMSRKGKRDQ